MFNVTSANPSNNLSNAFVISPGPVKVAFYPSRNRLSFGRKKVQIVLVWLEKMTCFMLKKYGDNRRSFSPMPIAYVFQLSLLYKAISSNKYSFKFHFIWYIFSSLKHDW